MLDTIYIARHGFRSNWMVSNSGDYSSTFKTKTGIPTDPELTSYGVDQAKQLAAYLANLGEKKPDLLISSPYYRCVQTSEPLAIALGLPIELIEFGMCDWHGTAPFNHPLPATAEVLAPLFPNITIKTDYETAVIPPRKGETMIGVHDRTAYALARLIDYVETKYPSIKSILIMAHASIVIAGGRALVGDENLEVGAGTCSLSTYTRRAGADKQIKWVDVDGKEVQSSGTLDLDGKTVPVLDWRNGKGIAGGWEVVANGDCSFLAGGEERNWWFAGDEAWDFAIEKGTGVEKTLDGAQTFENTGIREFTGDRGAKI